MCQKTGATLFINDKKVGESRIEKMVVSKFSPDEIFRRRNGHGVTRQ